MSFPKRLVRAMEMRGVTKEQLALATGMAAETIRGYMLGTRRQKAFELLARLARSLDVSADWLLGLTDEEPEWSVKRQAAHATRMDDLAQIMQSSRYITHDPLPDEGGQAERAHAPSEHAPRPESDDPPMTNKKGGEI
jgi:transcriptional regulator with XRE-family HTH domain